VVLSSISGLKNGIGLENVSNLTIRNCRQFRDASALNNVKTLCLEGHTWMSDVKGLEDIHTVSILTLMFATLHRFPGLGKNEKIIIERKYIGLLQANPWMTTN
jgi:hypothetical protein